jgi:hypothetical protein
MIFHSGNVQGLARFYRIPSSVVSFSGAGGAPLSVLRSLYQTVRRQGFQELDAKRNARGTDDIFMSARKSETSEI